MYMKTYSLITLKIGENTYNFTSGIIEVHNEEVLEIHVQKNIKNLSSLLDSEVDFISIGDSYRFYIRWEILFGVA